MEFISDLYSIKYSNSIDIILEMTATEGKNKNKKQKTEFTNNIGE